MSNKYVGVLQTHILLSGCRHGELSFETNAAVAEKLKVEPDEVGAKRLAAPLATASQPVSALAVAKRLACDQLIMAPLGLFVFITFFAICQGLEFEAYRERLKTLYVPLLLANYSVWPLIQTVNFRFLPLRYRVPFAASCGVRDA